jgi:hypothetical protein
VKLRSKKAMTSMVAVILATGAVPPVLMSGLLVAGLLIAPPAQAQNIGQRVVIGIVTDPSGNLVNGATVFLKDLKSKTIRSYNTDATGKFRFTQVNMGEDHELWAEKDTHKSAVKTVSEWDARKEFETELKLK